MNLVFHQLSHDGFIDQDLDQQMDGRILGKNAAISTSRIKNGAPGGVHKMIDVGELPVNGRALPLSNR